MYMLINSKLAMHKLLIVNLDDYNSWQESFWGRWKQRHLDKDVILAEGSHFPLFGNAVAFWLIHFSA